MNIQKVKPWESFSGLHFLLFRHFKAVFTPKITDLANNCYFEQSFCNFFVYFAIFFQKTIEICPKIL